MDPQPVTEAAAVSLQDLRQMMISEFGAWLRSRTSREGRPFQEDTVSAYTETARVLDRWMAAEKIDGDFTACGTAILNRFFADYIAGHSQGGTNTRQRNLQHLFTWLEEAYGHPHPYTPGLHRYAPERHARPPWHSSSSGSCWRSPEGAGHGISRTPGTTR
jgi:hypothetical protein